MEKIWVSLYWEEINDPACGSGDPWEGGGHGGYESYSDLVLFLRRR